MSYLAAVCMHALPPTWPHIERTFVCIAAGSMACCAERCGLVCAEIAQPPRKLPCKLPRKPLTTPHTMAGTGLVPPRYMVLVCPLAARAKV